MKMQALGRQLVVVARSHEGNVETARKLESLGFATICVDTVEFAPPDDWRLLDEALGLLQNFDWVVFTSPRAARVFSQRGRELGATLSGPKYASVGTSTSVEMAREGIEVDFIPTEFLTSALGRELPALPGERVLLCRADIADEGLTSTLQQRGIRVTESIAYTTRMVGGIVQAAQLTGADLIVFASPSEVAGFEGRVESGILSELRIKATAACIGPVTAQAARKAGFEKTFTPKIHTITDLVEEIARRYLDA